MKKHFFAFISLLAIVIAAKAQAPADSSLGIRLSSFNAGKQTNRVMLYWKVACFVSYANFDVQRSADGVHFTSIHQFQADYLRCQQPFEYADANAAGQVFYRLKVGNIDGRFSSEKIIRISADEITRTTIEVIAPVRGNFLQLFVSTNSDEKIDLQLINMQGSLLQTLSIRPGKGNSIVEVPVSLPQNGLYILRPKNSTQTKSIQFFKTS
ncbi:MAG: T9SS type A sorting domain-containing protein [Ferruginibacter sp.]